MKLRNKHTGEVKDWDFGNWYQTILNPDNKESYECTLTDFMDRTVRFREEWEEYEKPKEYWCIDWTGGINKIISLDSSHDKYEQSKKEIGNYFETQEEAEKAVEKLKAWKRLEDKGFRFNGWGLLEYGGCDRFDYSPHIGFSIPNLDKDEPYEYPEEIEKDLDICFGGGE